MSYPIRFTWLLLFGLPIVAGCGRGQPAGSREPSVAQASSVAASAPAAGSIERVTDPSLVCMVNNHFMGRPQIPVAVDGKTYYGCCAMCKDKLMNDPSARAALDPLTQKPVDKALAVIAKTNTGAALYFENEANLTAYAQRSKVN